MARIRSIKPTYWTDEKIGELPRDVRLLFLGIISAMADDAGRFKASARLVRVAVFPFDDDITAADVERWLGTLAAAGRVRLYTVEGERYGVVVNFLRHQKIDRASQSQLPAPTSDTREPSPESHDDSTNIRRALVESSASPRPVVEGSRRGEEELQQQQHDASNGDASSSATAVAVRVERTTVVRPERAPRARQPFAYPPEFEACWAAYPPRGSGDNPKRKAYDQWAARRAEGVAAETLLAGTARYAAYCAAAYGGPSEHVMHGATFFGRDRRYESAWTPPAASGTTAASPAPGHATAASAATEAEALYARFEAHGLLAFGGSREAYDAAIAAATPPGTDPAAFRALVARVKAWTLAAEGERRFGVRALERRLAAHAAPASHSAHGAPQGGGGTSGGGGGGTLRPALAAAMGGGR